LRSQRVNAAHVQTAARALAAGSITGISIAAGESLTLTGSLTIGADTTISGGGTLALGGFTLTVPATGTAALLGTANVFTALQTIDMGSPGAVTTPGLTLTGAVSGSNSLYAQIVNTNTAGRVYLALTESAGSTADFFISRRGSTSAALANTVTMANARAADFLLQTNSSDRIRMLSAGGGTLSGAWSITGNLTLSAVNLVTDTTTGMKIGTATSQKLALWNTTPDVQPTTAIAGATLTGGGGTTLTDTDTFDGYTLKQVIKALRRLGALA
jgi:hypothetical protein